MVNLKKSSNRNVCFNFFDRRIFTKNSKIMIFVFFQESNDTSTMVSMQQVENVNVATMMVNVRKTKMRYAIVIYVPNSAWKIKAR